MSEEELRKLMGALQQGTAASQSKAQAAAQKEYKFWSDDGATAHNDGCSCVVMLAMMSC